MKRTDCTICDSKDIPINETIRIDGNIYCAACFDVNFSDKKSLESRLVEKELDPTICSSCNNDFGDLELGKISRYPLCSDCEILLRNRTFPFWVKGFLAVLIIIVVSSFIWNWKFYQAYRNIKDANMRFASSNYADAYQLMNSASKKVPENEEIKTIATFFKGVDLLDKDKNAEALTEFDKCKDDIPADSRISTLINLAKIGVCFDKKDYHGFLDATRENLALDSTKAFSWCSVASAYACVYAEKGDAEDKANAIRFLQKAKSIDSSSKDMKEYYNMVEYRIDSRRIIRREEFTKEFPGGWNKK